MAFNEWATAVLHYGDNDPGSPPYVEAAISGVIDTATNYGTQTLGILAPQHRYSRSGETFRDVDGEEFDTDFVRRLVFDLELYPFDYASGGSWTLDTLETIEGLLTKPYKWIEFSISERTYHTAGSAIPIILAGELQHTVERDSGTRMITIPLRHRWAAD